MEYTSETSNVMNHAGDSCFDDEPTTSRTSGVGNPVDSIYQTIQQPLTRDEYFLTPLSVYQVTYQTVAIMHDGRHGNIIQSKDTAYCCSNIIDIQSKLESYLKSAKRYPIIQNIKKIDGHIL